MTTVSPPLFNESSDQEREDCFFLQVYSGVWQETFLTEQTYSNLLAIICINSLSVVPIILLNTMVIFLVLTKRRLRTNMNILLSSLAGTDLLTGLVVYPVKIAALMKRILGVGSLCTLETTCAVATGVTSFASLSHLALISADRYIAVKHPLRYQEIVTKDRLNIGVLFIWAITVLVALGKITFAVLIDDLSVYLLTKDSILAFIGLVYIAIIIHCNRYIFFETQRQQKRIRTEQLTHEEAKKIKKDYKATKTLFIILVALAFTYLPTMISILVVASNATIKPHVNYLLWSWCVTLASFGSLLNPVIYSWRSKKLRRAMLDVVRFRQVESGPSDTETTGTQRENRSKIQMSTHCEDDKNQVRSESCSEFCLRNTEAEIVDFEQETVT